LAYLDAHHGINTTKRKVWKKAGWARESQDTVLFLWQPELLLTATMGSCGATAVLQRSPNLGHPLVSSELLWDGSKILSQVAVLW
jgi:hypothetical protein